MAGDALNGAVGGVTGANPNASSDMLTAYDGQKAGRIDVRYGAGRAP